MKKAKLPLKAELDLGHTEDSTQKSKRKFAGTSNPRHLRMLRELLFKESLSREAVDRIAGVSNGPQIVAELRRLGLDLPCVRTPVVARDGRKVWRGVYWLTASDRRHAVVAVCKSLKQT
jgi:hypothetical protein